MNKQGTNEWHEDRSGNITASKFSDVLKRGRKKDVEFGDTAYTYAYDIVSEILTGEIDSFSNNYTDWGNTYEKDAINEYEKRTFNLVKETGYIEMEEKIGGSPDGLVGIDGIIEVKCPAKTRNHLINVLKREVPTEYYPQVQGYLMITGRKWCDFISYDPRILNDKCLSILRVERDDEYINMLHDRLIKFRETIIKPILNQLI